MSEILHLHYDVDGEDFVSCGHASEDVRRTLKSIGISGEVIRKVSIAMYEGEINMVIHADGGVADVSICEDSIVVTLSDTGKGIADIDQAMQPLFTTDRSGERGGMGFAIMESFCDKLKVVSKPGAGTTVTMTKKMK